MTGAPVPTNPSTRENTMQDTGMHIATVRESTVQTAVERDWTPLTDEQFESYEQNGYLHLKGLFSPEEVERGLAVIDEVVADGARTIENHASFTDRAHTVRVRDAVARTAGMDYFLDHPKLVGPLMSLLAGSVQLLGTEIFVRSLQDEALEYWHTDGGEYLQQLRLVHGSPSLQIKAQVFFTDTTKSDSGNFLLVPGSHRKVPTDRTALCYIEELDEPLRQGVLPDDALEVKAAPGDVLIFPYSLWHAVAPNKVQERKTFILRYGHLWHRPHDYLQQPAEVLDRMSPRLRRMFGDFGDQVHPTDYYKPVDQGDVMAVGGNHAAV
ncbi:phytanoyl-CoA dioxygenase family protein [Kitasatospora purpeofusca]|uniref:phytanoyl-CoA dioxygenase family protein n=1 Tax=Kitasatospora purpeofusca TaxID=67352 RepID=UPI0036E6D066